MAQENRVTVRFNPSIAVNKLEIADFESSLSEEDKRKLFDGTASTFRQRRGLMTPFVKIGDVYINPNKIKALSIRQEDFTPTVSVSFIDEGHVFSSRGFPLSNIVMTVHIQSPVKQLKSMTVQFLINSISSMPFGQSQQVMYTLSGEMFIPLMYANYSKSFKNMTSVETLTKVAQDLQLGFADNQNEGTNDTMTWIIPNYTYKEFITQVMKFAYKDDGNFFDCFVDRYYVLNFINVEKQFARDDEPDTGFMALQQTALNFDRVDPEGDSEYLVEVPIVLTNYPNAKNSEFYITDYSLMSNHGDILRNNAIRRYIYWYEHGAGQTNTDTPKQVDILLDNGKPTTQAFEDYEQFKLHFLEPLTSTVTNDGKKPQTVELPAYISESDNEDDGPAIATGVWSGMDYGNAHPSYKFAELLNYHNWLETEKNMLNVTLEGFSVNVLRGSRVKVELFMDKLSALSKESLGSELGGDYPDKAVGRPGIDDRPQSVVRDEFLSDFYYVKSIAYSYINGSFKTDLTLARRHWSLPLPKNQLTI